ncbi:hypothetical protein P280DRAFT_534484 [Massarina eburnea CBS 473.64]|uniref:DUF7918 domain-containing protein n=1 Tax=Massarina eburnea CBS 473.64 TaxID=1395130 RepID=A0A6A6RKK6_9PLEO|nr:hypothetical protein P280DRAFT_534484 [Massarina eburnea CBS 473.64]
MAVHPKIEGLKVAIFVNDQQLKEYNDRPEESQSDASTSTTVERFIEAETGVNFEIRYKFSRPFPQDRSVSMVVTIDGQNIDEPLVRPRELFDKDGHVSAGSITNAGCDFFLQKYQFSPLDITESDGRPIPDAVKHKLEPVGKIQLKFHFLENAHKNPTIVHTSRSIRMLGQVNEKAIKGDALSHAVSFAEAEPTDALEFFDADYADNGHPFAIFIFYYRSLAALKDLHIIPRTPELLNFEDCDGITIRNSSIPDIARMFAHWKRRNEVQQRIKQERSESVTVVGDDEIRGDGENGDDDVQFVRAVKRQKHGRQLPGEGDEVVELE